MVHCARRLSLIPGLTLVAASLLAIAGVAQEKEQPLPLQRVVLFSSSVGFFEHQGQVDGKQQIEFSFKTTDINDLLKSMVVQDRDGGLIKAVNYGSPEPLTRTLRTLAIDLTDSPTLAEIFQQLRGLEVELKTPVTLSGTIVGVEVRQLPLEEGGVAEMEVLHLRTKEGLQSVRLESIEQTRFLSDKVEQDFQHALELLSGQRSADMKTVKLDFQGDGKRNVAVGYIQESPVWKTSYRLVLADDKPPFLQGWAIVENTSTQDWQDVELTLVSGRPISFLMDLYQPLYIERPFVTPERYASLTSRTYDQDLAADPFADPDDARRRSGREAGAAMGGLGGFGGGGGFFGGATPGAAGESVRPVGDGVVPFDPRQGVATAAAGQDVGELFRYAIQTPVTLARSESAMLPIVNDEVQGEKVSIFNPAVHAKHPLVGLQLTNSTDLHLLQGPITVFDGNEYAGDARIEDLPPGGKRLVSYALDLETEIAVESRPEQRQIAALSVSKGGLHLRHKASRQTLYTIKNSGDKPKQVLLERPIDADWTIASPEPAEKTRALYRFAASAPPGKPLVVEVAEQRDLVETLALADVSIDQVQVYLTAKAASPALRSAFEEMIQKKSRLSDLTQQRDAVERRVTTLSGDQDRIRQNLRAVSGLSGDAASQKSSGELLQRYLKMLAETEDELAKQRTAAAELLRAEEEARDELEDYLEDVTAD